MSGDTIFGDVDAILFEESLSLISEQMGRQQSFFAKSRMVAPPHGSERVRSGENILARFDWVRLDDPAGAHDLDRECSRQFLTDGARSFSAEVGGDHRMIREAVIEAARVAEVECRAEGMRLRDAEHETLVDGLFGQLQRHAGAFDQTPPSLTMSADARAAWETARDRARDLMAALDDVRRTLPRSKPPGANEDYADKALLRALAIAFKAISGAKAGQSRYGPFARFACAAYRFLGRLPPNDPKLDERLGRVIERGTWKKTAIHPGKSERK